MRYQTVAFLQGDDYNEIADMGVEEMADYLREWDYGDNDDSRTVAPWGSSDTIYLVGYGEVLTVNHGFGYAALTYVYSR